MAKPGQNEGNKHAALKPGEIGRVQITQSLSGKKLKKLLRHFGIDPAQDKELLEDAVRKASRKIVTDFIDQLPE